MSTPDPYSAQPGRPEPAAAPSWGEDGDRTTAYPGAAGGYGGIPSGPISAPLSGPAPVNPDPAALSGSTTPDAGYGYGYGAPAYSNDPAPESGATAVYPPAPAPSYAPAGYPQPYAQPMVVPPPPYAQPAVANQGSRAAAGAGSAVLGLLLSLAGLYLLAKFGFEAQMRMAQNFEPAIAQIALAAFGGLLLFAAALLNAWSGWATLIPGIVFTAAGGYGMVSFSGLEHLSKWTEFAFSRSELVTLISVGAVLALGLVLLGASISAFISRAAGRRSATG